MNSKLIENYFEYLINHFFKILPLKEGKENTLPVYIESLQAELLGFEKLFKSLNYNGSIVTLISILQYLIDRPECPTHVVKREVFKAISICEHLLKSYRGDD